MKYSYSNPVKIVFGRGRLVELDELVRDRRAVLVTMPDIDRLGVVDHIREVLGHKLAAVTTRVIPNPTIASISDCYQAIEGEEFDVIIALGGGSALDTAKAAALLVNTNSHGDWLSEHLRNGASIPPVVKGKPVIAIPTTSGTGSEVTMWATVWDELSGDKYSIADPSCYAEWALLDPDLTDSLPYETSLFTALDALSHSMEAIWNWNSNPVSDALGVHSISISAPVLEHNFKDNYSNAEVRNSLMNASLLAGLAFSNTKTALAHSISYPLTSKFGMPHGLACSFTLPEIMRLNYPLDPNRVGLIVQALGCSSIESAIHRLNNTFSNLNLDGYINKYLPRTVKIEDYHVEFIKPERAGNNIRQVTQEEAEDIVRAASKLTSSD